MSKHTPGPWKAYCHDALDERSLGDTGIRFWTINQTDGGEYRGGIANVHAAEHIGGIKLAERDANARLIAAAPELVVALQECEEFFDDRADADLDHTGYTPNPEMRLLQTVREALRKAGVE